MRKKGGGGGGNSSVRDGVWQALGAAPTRFLHDQNPPPLNSSSSPSFPSHPLTILSSIFWLLFPKRLRGRGGECRGEGGLGRREVKCSCSFSHPRGEAGHKHRCQIGPYYITFPTTCIADCASHNLVTRMSYLVQVRQTKYKYG